jgi:hypothetical protein
MFWGTRGLPRGLDFHRQSNRKPIRCQPRKVSGLTWTRASRQAKSRESRTKDKRVAPLARRGFHLALQVESQLFPKENVFRPEGSPRTSQQDKESQSVLGQKEQDGNQTKQGTSGSHGAGACHGYASGNNPYVSRTFAVINSRYTNFLRRTMIGRH